MFSCPPEGPKILAATMNRKRNIMLTETINDCATELEALDNAVESLRIVAETSYGFGAELEFLDGLDRTIADLLSRIAYVQQVKADCHKAQRTAVLSEQLP